MSKVKVKLLKTFMHDRQVRVTGEVIEVSPTKAEELSRLNLVKNIEKDESPNGDTSVTINKEETPASDTSGEEQTSEETLAQEAGEEEVKAKSKRTRSAAAKE
ncbi:hypothetical protein P676_3313 [Acinetobacter baumannii UH7607]|uniref:hypothetical protein n=1 Tax=Acinetobacter baumannii TaxID=470 RepID=UPI0003DF316F|nr:hypothetical protein [Acinetobacter baumannii]ETR09689.1 hypothetical protein P676_3313 [Acinetobacter baumannii UH7607]OVM21733.1 hypothetical protein B4S41_18570 [Acinetobacter baumannii]OVN98202.1 hypothetical protein B9S50_00730 [Acinetobacter baumannii]